MVPGFSWRPGQSCGFAPQTLEATPLPPGTSLQPGEQNFSIQQTKGGVGPEEVSVTSLRHSGKRAVLVARIRPWKVAVGIGGGTWECGYASGFSSLFLTASVHGQLTCVLLALQTWCVADGEASGQTLSLLNPLRVAKHPAPPARLRFVLRSQENLPEHQGQQLRVGRGAPVPGAGGGVPIESRCPALGRQCPSVLLG